MMKKYIMLGVIFCCAGLIQAQQNMDGLTDTLLYPRFIERVMSNNLTLLSQKYDVEVAQAALVMSHALPDPSLSAGYKENHDGSAYAGNAYSAGISSTLELGGKRRSRIRLAEDDKKMSALQLQHHFNLLRSEATVAWLNALLQIQLTRVNENSYYAMQQLADADSIRLISGAVRSVDALQSRLEAKVLYNELARQKALQFEACNHLAELMGEKHRMIIPAGELQMALPVINADSLMQQAMQHHPLLLMAQMGGTISGEALRLARRDYIPDLDLSLEAENAYAPAVQKPATEISGGVAIPLKFSSHYRGAVQMARIQQEQARLLLQQTEMELTNQILILHNHYRVARNEVASYRQGMLQMAQKVKEGKVYSYQRGETSLLEVLEAQRTYNDLMAAWYNTLFQGATTLVNLQTAAAVWRVQL